MVLNKGKGNPGIRFLLGISIIALSIYLFYVSMARQNSPELFLVPHPVSEIAYECRTVRSLRLEACIPGAMSSTTAKDGTINFYSIEPNIRGSIKLYNKLPGESEWKASLKSPFVRMFIGNVDKLDPFELMLKLLYRRWNPTLMGPKSRLMPKWMKGSPGACILLPPVSKAIVFYSHERSIGMRFYKRAVAILSITGDMDKNIVIGIIDSVKPA